MKQKVLVVEDEAIIAADIEDRLANLGYEIVAVCSSGEDALESAREHRPDVVLMDIILQGEMDGVEAAREIRETLDIPVIYLTVHSDDGTLDRAKATEPFGYLLKPFDEKELKVSIEIAIYRHKMEREQRRLVAELQEALAKIKTLSGLLPICSSCKKIRDDQGYWSQVETYLARHADVEFTHGICPECMKMHYPEFLSKDG